MQPNAAQPRRSTSSNSGRVVIAGAGLAGLRVAEALRREQYEGEIVLVGDEPHPPYDRPPLSKEVLTGTRSATDVVLRDRDQLATLDIEVELGVAATAVDVSARRVRLATGTLSFDELVIATGARARNPWADPVLDGVQTLRTLDDARLLRERLVPGQPVVIAGAGFIGAEVASSARQLGLDVTVVELAELPLVHLLGAELGARLLELHRRQGTRVACGVGVAAVRGSGRVEEIELTDGSRLPCSLLVVGAGVVPNTEWLTDSGLPLDDGIVCDPHLRAAPHVWAAGDLASWLDPWEGRRCRHEHWMSAIEQARHVARSIVRGPEAVGHYSRPGYFWSDQYGRRLQLVGSARAEQLQLVDAGGGPDSLLALFRRGGRLVGAFAIDAPRDLMRCKGLLESRASWEDALDTVAAGAAA
jgi:NADPH-dependent 2,4-dienoyl-CoA reductase/sulfur reductase-like enzyme